MRNKYKSIQYITMSHLLSVSINVMFCGKETFYTSRNPDCKHFHFTITQLKQVNADFCFSLPLGSMGVSITEHTFNFSLKVTLPPL